MRGSNWFVAAGAAACVVQLTGCERTVARAEERQVEKRAVELTVYAEDFALVHETRPIELKAGTQKVQLTQVSKQLDPRSVMLSWPESAGLPAPTSNSYDLGVNSGGDLMKRYLGQQVELVRYNEHGSEAERQEGTLMISGDGQTVIQSDGKFLINPPGTIVAPAQSDVVTIPQLAVQVDSPAAKSADLSVSYLTRGLSWGADYVASVLPSDDTISLQCWATITNKTGASYPAAKITLMAGQPNRAALNAKARAADGEFVAGTNFVDGHMAYGGRSETQADSLALRAPEAVGDLQAYSVEKPADIVQDQMNRVMLLSSERVAIKREYRADMPSLASYDYGYGEQQTRGPVQMAFSFRNSGKYGLGAPLPAGILRVYGTDSGGGTRYLGASNVWNAPKDAKVDVTLANAFDLYTMRTVKGFKKINKRTIRKTIQVVLHNAKSVPAEIVVNQPIEGKWKIASETETHKNADASTARWTIAVPAIGQKTLEFAVDLSS